MRVSEQNMECDTIYKFVKNDEYIDLKLEFIDLKDRQGIESLIFRCSSLLCEMNYLHFEYWNCRYKILKWFFKNFSSIKTNIKNEFMKIYNKSCKGKKIKFGLLSLFAWSYRKRDFIEMEIEWITKILRKNYKNYQIWNHISLFSEIVALNPSDLHFINEFLMIDSRNINLWSFIASYVKRTTNFTYGLDITKKEIKKDISNNSALSCRLNLLQEAGIQSKEYLHKELSMIEELIQGNNERSGINYIFGMCKIFDFNHYLNDMCLSINSDYIKLKLVSSIIAKKSYKRYKYCEFLLKNVKEESDLKSYLLNKLSKKY